MGYGARTESRSLGTAVAIGFVMWLIGLFLTMVVGVIGLAGGVRTSMRLFGTVSGGLFEFIGLHSFDLGVFVLVPVVLLVAAGFFMGAGGARNPASGFKEGAKITVSYCLMTLLGMVVLLALVGGRGIDLIESIVRAGIVFPVIFGGTGGALGAVL